MVESTTNSLAWNEDTVYALGLYRAIGRSLGIWPLRCRHAAAKIQFLSVVILQLFMNYNLVHEFISRCISFFEAIDFIGLFAANSVGLLKISLLRLHRKKMYRIVRSAVKDWSNIRDVKTKSVMRRYAYFGRFVGIFQLSTAYISALPIIFGAPPSFDSFPILSPEDKNSSITLLRNLPMGSGCSIIDWPTVLYLSFYIFQLIQLLIMCTCVIGSDALFFGIVMHVCAQIELLKIDILRLGQDSNEICNIKNDLAAVIHKHNHLAVLVGLIEDVFHLVILGLLTGTSFHMTVTGVQMLYGLREGNHLLFLHSIIVLSILSLQLYVYTYAGDYLASQMNELRDAAYGCSWYNFSDSIKKDVMFIIMRSSDRFHLTAGKVYRMNINNFTSIIKTMASFFTVINLMIET